MPRPRLAAPLLAAALALSACGSADGDVAADTTSTTAPETAGPAETNAPETSAAPADVPDQLDFVAPDVRGGQVVGADYAGQAMVIWFWAPW